MVNGLVTKEMGSVLKYGLMELNTRVIKNKLILLGEWRMNKAHGKGKFIHVDGDLYEGEWIDDKANGYGVYIHANGTRYEGNWLNDF